MARTRKTRRIASSNNIKKLEGHSEVLLISDSYNGVPVRTVAMTLDHPGQ